MKGLFKFFALAVIVAAFALASCNKQGTTPSGPESVDEYVIEITVPGGETKAGSADIYIADLDPSLEHKKTIKAQLKKNSGSGFVDVTTGVEYTWSATSQAGFSYSKTDVQNPDITAVLATTSPAIVSAAINGKTVATAQKDIAVGDGRTLSWKDVPGDVADGKTYEAKVTSNFTGGARIYGNNNITVGASRNSLSSEMGYNFSSSSTETNVYFKNPTGAYGVTATLYAIAGSTMQVISSAEKVFVVRRAKWETATKSQMEDVYIENVENLGSSHSLSRGELLAYTWTDFNTYFGVHDFNAAGLGQYFEDLDSHFDSDVMYDLYGSGYPYSACNPYLTGNGNYYTNMYRTRLGLN